MARLPLTLRFEFVVFFFFFFAICFAENIVFFEWLCDRGGKGGEGGG